MTAAEQQSEELEVLKSIFDGDDAFSITAENAVHYRFGAEGESRSFILEIRWPPSYPDDDIPEFNLDVFFNKHLNTETKMAVLQCLQDESETLRGSPMTYSLIELVKDRFEQLTEKQMTNVIATNEENTDSDDNRDAANPKQKQGRSEKLTKAQKRKQWDRGQANDERPRGWNWVDIVKHLSQTGNQ